MKKLSFILLAVVLCFWVITLILPAIVDANRNVVLQKGPHTVSEPAQTLFNSLDFVGDLHCDALLWDRDLAKENDRGQVDLPRMRKGHVTLQAFTIVTKSPRGQNMQRNSGGSDNITPLMIAQGRPFKTWFSLAERAVDQCRDLGHYADDSNGKFRVIHDQKELKDMIVSHSADPEVIGGFLGIEGGHCLEGKLEKVDRFFDEGVRMMGPTHFFDNELGGSAHGLSGGGLTAFGKQVIARMNELGMIIDLAHSSPALVNDVLNMSTRPVLCSHTGVKGTFDSPRNLSDEQIKGIAATHGIIGITYFKQAIGSTDPKDIVKAMKYVKELVGAQYVALGSDYDGSVTTQFDCTGLSLLVEEMMKQGFSENEIRGIMGDNMKQFLLKNLPQ